jgi:hypothetical protein
MTVLNRYIFAAIIFVLIISPTGIASEDRYEIPVADSPTWGPENAPVTIIEFIDYQ